MGSDYSVTKQITLTVETPVLTSVARADGYGITLTWDPVPYANRYHISRASSPGGAYEVVNNNFNGTAFIDQYTGFDYGSGTSHYYKVKAEVPGYNETVYSQESGAMGCELYWDSTTITSAQRLSGAKAQITWAEVAHSDGYALYCATEPEDPYTSVYTGNAITYENTSLSATKHITTKYALTSSIA